MDELNRNQFILLVLLISFVTSIATGIVTVTLMDQAPPAVTQTINRVVERTIERVVPNEQVATVVKEVPVVVTEEEMITKAFNQVSPAVLRLAKSEGDNLTGIGSAVLFDRAGRLVTQADLVLPPAEDSMDQIGQFKIIIGGDQQFTVEVLPIAGRPMAELKVIADERESFISAIAEIPIPEQFTESLLVGQTVIGVGATSGGNHLAAVGIVSQRANDQQIIRTNAANSDNLGGPLLDIQGRIIGFNIRPGQALAIDVLNPSVD